MSAHRFSAAIAGAAIAMNAAAVAQVIPPGLGWHELPNTRLRPHCPSDAQYPGIYGNSGCASVTGAWGGAAFDAVGNRLLIMGGGHGDWAGNEVYELDLDTIVMRRINNPSYPLRDGCIAGNGSTYADGRPVSRHTYNHLEWLPTQNLMFLYGGSRWQCGYLGDDTWTFDPALDLWTPRSNANAPDGNFSLSVVRDPVSGLLYARDVYHLHSYNPATHTWSQRSTDADIAVNSYKSAVIDPVRRRYYFYVAENRVLHSYDITNTTAQLTVTSTPAPSCAFMDRDAAGWQYDPVLDRLVAWNGGNTVHILDATNATCTTQEIPGGPTATNTGTYGRFRYSPVSGAYVSCNGIDDNCYALRLSDRIFADGFGG